jgi:quercetin dioxygenase-like cupin family protein
MYANANWKDLKWTEVRPGVRRKVFTGEGMTMVYNELQPGHEPKPHHHPHEQIATVTEGTCDYHVGDEVFHMVPGGLVLVPPNVEHYAVNTSKVPLINIDIFTPRRDDYI